MLFYCTVAVILQIFLMLKYYHYSHFPNLVARESFILFVSLFVFDRFEILVPVPLRAQCLTLLWNPGKRQANFLVLMFSRASCTKRRAEKKQKE